MTAVEPVCLLIAHMNLYSKQLPWIVQTNSHIHMHPYTLLSMSGGLLICSIHLCSQLNLIDWCNLCILFMDFFHRNSIYRLLFFRSNNLQTLLDLHCKWFWFQIYTHRATSVDHFNNIWQKQTIFSRPRHSKYDYRNLLQRKQMICTIKTII